MVNIQSAEGGSDATGTGDFTLDSMGERMELAGQTAGVAAATEPAASQGAVSVLALDSSFGNVSQSTLADAIELDSTPPTSSDGPQWQSQSSQQSRQSQQSQQSQLCGQQHSFQQPKKPVLEIQSPKTPTMKSVEMTPSPSIQQPRAHSQQASPGNRGFTLKDLGLGVSTGGGQKRTASGAIKPASTSVPTSPMDAVDFEHSRESSTSSVGAHRIGEMSAQLKARLSYALIKVQNGWQSRTLDEVESIYAHQTSPISPPAAQSTFHGSRKPLASPRTAPAKHKREKSITWGGSQGYSTSFSSVDSELGITSPSGFRYAAGVNNSNVKGRGSGVTNGAFTAAESSKQHIPGNPTTTTTTSSSPSAPLSVAERTYESFWRDHSSNPVTAKIVQARAAVSSTGGGNPTIINLSPSPPGISSTGSNAPPPLAPPANITPSCTTTANLRRTAQPHRVPPPPLPISTLSNLSNSSYLSTASSSSTSIVPNTPPQRRSATQTQTQTQTPQQSSKTAMEQDAVETLMFMSSPGNSQRDPPSATNTTTTRPQPQPHLTFPLPLPPPPPPPPRNGLPHHPGDDDDDDEDDDDAIVVGSAAAVRASSARLLRPDEEEDDELDRMLDGMGGGAGGAGSGSGSDG